MPVPVMQIRPMRMGMGHGLMRVQMGMDQGFRLSGMDMVMVAVVMAMGVYMLQGRMMMLVGMAIAKEQEKADAEKQGGPSLDPGRLLAQHEEGQP